MKKAIAGVLVVLGMYVPDTRSFTLCSQDTAAYLRAEPYDMARVQRRSTSTRVTAGVGGAGLALWLGFEKSGKKRQTTPRSTIVQPFFHGNPGKKEEI